MSRISFDDKIQESLNKIRSSNVFFDKIIAKNEMLIKLLDKVIKRIDNLNSKN